MTFFDDPERGRLQGSGNPYANVEPDDKHPDELRLFGRHVELSRTAAPVPHRQSGRPYSRDEIEQRAYALLRRMWEKREELFGSLDVSPFVVRDPFKAFEMLGYRVKRQSSLGQLVADGEAHEAAGIIDSASKTVLLADHLAPEKVRYTLGHELGHAELHDGIGLHRDRAPDGSSLGVRRDRKEIEADIFAAAFLMPEKLVRREFTARFKTNFFELNDSVAFALGAPLEQLTKQLSSTRSLTLLLAHTGQFDGKHFVSLADCFGISTTAMARRIEELHLIKPIS